MKSARIVRRNLSPRARKWGAYERDPLKVDKVDKSAKVEAGSKEAMIRLEIRDAKGNVLVRKSDPVKLARGKVVYCEVKVSSDSNG